MADLKHELLRIASDLPKGDPTRRKILGALREAHAGNEILARLVDERKFVKLYNEVEKQDEQSADLLLKVRHALIDALKISDNEYNALGRVQQLVAAQGRWDIGLQRNNIFKAANLLGLKLPSAMFASDQSKAQG